MNDLERFAAVLLAEWQNGGGHPGGAISVSGLLDRTLPYRTARRTLSLESSEDYEALVLRLVGEEYGLVVTDPLEAAEMARSTLESKIPDLDVLRLLRSATVTFTDEAVARLDGVRPLPQSGVPPVEQEFGDGAAVPKPDVLPIRRVATPEPEPPDHTAVAVPQQDAGPPPSFLTRVEFSPPEGSCWQCSAPLPEGRSAKFCVECGADQRQPRCGSCGATVERNWKFCPECGGEVRRET
ncbi:MAG TPA: zinc ribbon domain-containing protein [Gemmatimonadales bacterium]|nr:zinc ribbon domain-containing protein [Gemmatimonadales bacterium]